MLYNARRSPSPAPHCGREYELLCKPQAGGQDQAGTEGGGGEYAGGGGGGGGGGMGVVCEGISVEEEVVVSGVMSVKKEEEVE